MAFLYTSDELISSIKRRGRVPSSQSTFSNDAILKMCDEEILLGLLPRIMAANEDYLFYDYSTPLVSGTDTYRIPNRAVGGRIKTVQIADSGDNRIDVPYVQYADLAQYREGSSNPVYTILNNNVVIAPAPTSSSDTLYMPVYLRPNTLVQLSAVGKITAINGNVLTLSAVPSTFVVGAVCDLVKSDGLFEHASIDKTITAVSGNNVTFTSVPSSLAVNDYVCLAGETPIPQIPAEMHPLLSMKVAHTILLALGFTKEATALESKIKEAKEAVSEILEPRTETARKINARNNTLRQRSYRWS